MAGLTVWHHHPRGLPQVKVKLFPGTALIPVVRLPLDTGDEIVSLGQLEGYVIALTARGRAFAVSSDLQITEIQPQ